MQPHVQRMIEEFCELNEKIEKLKDFVEEDNVIFSKLEPIDQGLLMSQVGAMITYVAILSLRLVRNGIDVDNLVPKTH